MSGIEVAGLAIGVVPIFVEILKSYGTAKRRLKTLNRYVEVVSDIQLGFQVAAACFNNDCRLILQAVVAHPGEVTAMVEDPSHKIWQEESDDIEEKLRSLLQEDYELCQSVVVRVRDILRETQKSLTRLDGDINKNGKQTQKESMRRLWSAFNTATKENEYLQQLESLNRWNKTLSRLRKQRCKIKKSRTFSSVCITRKTTPRSYQQIRTASQQLGKSLHESWSCTNASHSGHQAKLSLDVKSGQQDVQLDIVVACQPKLCEETQRSLPDTPIWLQIRSITSVATFRPPTLPRPLLMTNLCDVLQAQAEEVPIKAKGKGSKKRVRFGTSEDYGRNVRTPEHGSSEEPMAASFVTLDLKTKRSVCCHVNEVHASNSVLQDGCVGYLDIANDAPITRFIFYDASKLSTAEMTSVVKSQEAVPIQGLVGRLRFLQQITLALKLAEAVLQFHTTSWLPQTWTLEDFAYFKSTEQSDTIDVSDALSSLHLSNRFPDHPSSHAGAKPASFDLKHTYGIRNLSLARLGIALLEICTKGKIIKPTLDHTPLDVIEARKMLDEEHHSIMGFGRRYIDIVRKCIYCDFSCEDDLGSEALQSAVYTEVVCVLQDMKRDWEKYFGL